MDNHLQQSGKSENQERKEAGELLDESWFFGNLLDRKPKTMSRCYSDSSMLRGKSMEETFSSINRLVEGKSTSSLILLSRGAGKGLKKTPSLPPAPTVTIKQQDSSDHHQADTNDPTIIPEPLRSSLLRAPSLPVFAGTEDVEDDDDDESDFCMGKLIRQASLNQSKILLRQTSLNHPRVLPPRQTPKSVTRSCSISTLGNKKPEPENIIASISGSDSGERKSNCAQNHSKTIRKGHSGQDIDNNDLQGFNNLGLNSQDKEKVSRRAYYHIPSEAAAWPGKSLGPPPLHGGVASRKSAEDMKAQIKFWARAVASNVHQEC